METSSPSSSLFALWVSPERIRESFSSIVSALISKLFGAIFILLFAEVGATIGAMAGALLGLKTESGFLRGVKIGAVKGSILSVKIFKFSVALCQNDYYSKEFGCLLPVVDAIETLSYSTALFIEDVLVNVMRCKDDHADDIPKMRITDDNLLMDTSSDDRISCSICLQEFQTGDLIHCLPHCKHIYHQPCINKWLTAHNSCPLCRRNV
ncbi:NEP1-interacting protein-like 1 [Carica papaya]|uniref:NEP1-interacting protein-like 1 n=1 Tax=Carica papaya TaxID=3649 RepID=UPI000B8D193C|nr:NEP1-interacting protein-like 1 [Carica papaya]